MRVSRARGRERDNGDRSKAIAGTRRRAFLERFRDAAAVAEDHDLDKARALVLAGDLEEALAILRGTPAPVRKITPDEWNSGNLPA